MNHKNIAKILGKRGGLARAKNLSAEKRKAIAKAGAKARMESLKLAKRIEVNFRYLEMLRAFKPVEKSKSVKTTKSKLPGIYA